VCKAAQYGSHPDKLVLFTGAILVPEELFVQFIILYYSPGYMLLLVTTIINIVNLIKRQPMPQKELLPS
jgi:hypothetical protein